MALLEEIQLKSIQEEQQPRNRCCSPSVTKSGYTQPSRDKLRRDSDDIQRGTHVPAQYIHTTGYILLQERVEKRSLNRSEEVLGVEDLVLQFRLELTLGQGNGQRDASCPRKSSQR